MTTTEKLNRLHNGPTRYELVAEKGDERILIAYSMRTGRRALLTAAQKHGHALLAMMKLDDNTKFEFLKPAAKGAKVGDWTIRFSGRTQRDAISNGELPWIVDRAGQEAK